ncbi:alginate O-acetyltransferase AlgX-related protein [Aeromonas veronii]
MFVKPLYGKNGWMFLDGDNNRTIDQMTGNLILGDEQLKQWEELLKSRLSRLSEKNIEYIYICAPNKESVYKKFLPEWYKPAQETPIHQLIPIFTKLLSNKFIYPVDALVNSPLDTYPQGDTHWNQYGAYKCFQELEKVLGRADTLADVNFVTRNLPGDLGKKIDSSYLESQPVASFSKSTFTIEFDNKVNNRGRIIIFNNPDAPVKKKVVFFRDSFGSQLIHFLARAYSRVVAIWQPSLDYSIIDFEQPDLVISEQVERFLISPPSDTSSPTAEEIALSKNCDVNLYYSGK